MTVSSNIGIKSEALQIMKWLRSACCLLFFSGISLAQDSTEITPTDTLALTDSLPEPIEPGYTKKVNHELLDSLSRFQLGITKVKCPNTVKGFRVQIFSCSGTDCQEKAENIYNQFLIAFPDIPAHKLWEPPSIKVRVGNCRNRFEAEAIKNKIKEDFPFLFVVNDFIESPYQVECEVKE